MNLLRFKRERPHPQAVRSNAIRLGRILDRIRVLRSKRRKAFRRLNRRSAPAKWPQIFTARRSNEFKASMAFVV